MNWYCATYNPIDIDGELLYPSCDYYTAENHTEATEKALQFAQAGIDKGEYGHLDNMTLSNIAQINPNTLEIIEIIYF